ncbi:TetR family transcriptional regulator C-terminal domain-containing protein [Blastococcus goldschmidtiae]|uniref:TetR family transcriptional regulator C-terminal domain-containing protein n=1 Tax=Blastococcus goldschmidtiae TaxID=3075546 RepID=A0ABU2KD72_9ACTN|nr:TetR family transcriptional regulator C-terminal domain-containing protein [Blastococcus sp. DSM 46792]MDT0278114.1 TetR family transcriptional regulator C-terminal domain-containing protein [Blastococcus sp. DSM 46792]
MVRDGLAAGITRGGSSPKPCTRLRDPSLQSLAREQYRAYTDAASRLLARAAELTGRRWDRPVPELARLLVTVVDGATTTWLVDRDTSATREVLDAAVGSFVAAHAA